MNKRIRQYTTKAFAVPPRERALNWLRTHSWPRLVMSMMLMVTVGAAFLSSVQMHHFGVSPLLRYPSAVLAGWIIFLLLVSVWVMWQRYRHAPQVRSASSARSQSQNKKSDKDGTSAIDIFPNNGGSSSGTWHGGGGRFGGGGASESFAAAPEEVGTSSAPSIFDSGTGSSASSGSSGSFDFDLDVDGELGGFLFLVGAIIVVALAVFGAAFYAVYNAPIFFAELLIDGGVGTWLYKRANVADRPDWISTAIKRSIWPVVILVVMFTGLAWTMDFVAPGAMTLGAAFNSFINATQ
jgi:hypothetical protein